MKLRFGLRSLLWMTLLAGVLLGWWVDHRKLASAKSSSIHMFVKDSFELKTSWPVYRVECSNDPVCELNHVGNKRIRFVGRKPGKVLFRLWEKGQPTPSEFLIVVSPSP